MIRYLPAGFREPGFGWAAVPWTRAVPKDKEYLQPLRSCPGLEGSGLSLRSPKWVLALWRGWLVSFLLGLGRDQTHHLHLQLHRWAAGCRKRSCKLQSHDSFPQRLVPSPPPPASELCAFALFCYLLSLHIQVCPERLPMTSFISSFTPVQVHWCKGVMVKGCAILSVCNRAPLQA